MTKDYSDQIAALRAQQEKTAKQILSLQSKAKDEQRKRDTRRKIVVGGAILVAMEKDEQFARVIKLLLSRQVGRAIDREAIADLLPPNPATAAALFTPAAARMSF